MNRLSRQCGILNITFKLDFRLQISTKDCCTHSLLWLVFGVLSIATIFIALFSFLHHYMFRPLQAILRWNIQYKYNIQYKQIKKLKTIKIALLFLYFIHCVHWVIYFLVALRLVPYCNTTATGCSIKLNYNNNNNKKTPWSESANELYRPSDRRLSAKWLSTFAHRGCHVVSVTDPYGRILGFLDRSRYFSIK
jgi:hypothetical protein